jgi:deoxyribodipyrimidine photo-lyase
VETAIVIFTRDLRVHDNPALALACKHARQVLPVFIVDPALPAPPNRATFGLARLLLSGDGRVSGHRPR